MRHHCYQFDAYKQNTNKEKNRSFVYIYSGGEKHTGMIYWLHLQITKLKKFERNIVLKHKGVTHTVNTLKTHSRKMVINGRFSDELHF